MNIEYISVSRKQLWDECHQKYKYKYHLALPPEGPEPFYFVYGKIVHAIAELYVSQGGNKTLSEVTQEVVLGLVPMEEDKEGNPRFAPSIPPEYKNRMSEHLRSIQRLTEQIGMDGMLEYGFNYDLDPPKGKYVKGFIDRLINRQDNWFIIDYKTTKRGGWRKDNKSVVHDLQLRCYASVVQKQFNVPAEKIQAALYYLEGGNLISTKFTQQALDSVDSELIEAFDQIKAMPAEAARGTVGRHCTRCDYKEICPFYNTI